jgi:hypothetical protein
MRKTITRKSTGRTFDFWMRDGGGYVWLEFPNKPATMGQQICNGGHFMGSTMSATPETFNKKCRNWYNAAVKNGNIE